MPYLTLSKDNFKRLLGQGGRPNLFAVQIPTIHLLLKRILASRAIYYSKISLKNLIQENKAIVALGERLLLKMSSPTVAMGFFSLCKSANYTSEGYDVLTNSVYTRKVLGKINLSQINVTFYIDEDYFIYELFNFIKDSVLLDKKYGVYEYPETYTIDTLKVASLPPDITLPLLPSSNTDYLSLGISVKNYHNCVISNISEITKDSSSSNSVEEFTVTFEYETSDSGSLVDLAEFTTIASTRIAKGIGRVVSSLTKEPPSQPITGNVISTQI